MNAYPIILSIFVVAMISIISSHKNKEVKHTDVKSKIVVANPHQDDKPNISVESDVKSVDYDSIHSGIDNTGENETVIAQRSIDTESKIFSPDIPSIDLPLQKKVTQIQVNEKDLETEILDIETTFNFTKPTKVATKATTPLNAKKISEQSKIKAAVAKVSYWDTVHSIESKQGKLLYRPRNKSRSCTYTTAPCGHHQLTVRALKDIGCKSLQCRKDRLNYSKSLEMSKKLLAKNENRLKKNGYENLEDYQRYLIHQQGASGIKVILAATKGEKLLSKTIKKNMANNSPYSYRQLNRMGSRLAARMFMSHWKHKWEKEKLLVAGIASTTESSSNLELNVAKNQTLSQLSADSFSLPLFNESDIQLALNYKF